MRKRGRSAEESEGAYAEQTDAHSEAHAIQIAVGEGLQGQELGGSRRKEDDCSCGHYGGPHLPPYEEYGRPVNSDDFKPKFTRPRENGNSI